MLIINTFNAKENYCIYTWIDMLVGLYRRTVDALFNFRVYHPRGPPPCIIEVREQAHPAPPLLERQKEKKKKKLKGANCFFRNIRSF